MRPFKTFNLLALLMVLTRCSGGAPAAAPEPVVLSAAAQKVVTTLEAIGIIQLDGASSSQSALLALGTPMDGQIQSRALTTVEQQYAIPCDCHSMRRGRLDLY
jgi:hypothetical protein